jgi:hypothetical protein
MLNKKMTTFIPGLKLSGFFYTEAVQPILERHFTRLAYSAARIDYGSDVLGFDTPQSTDHFWGPRFTLFLSEDDFVHYKDRIKEVLSWELPFEIHGYPTHFRDADDPNSGGHMQLVDKHPIVHGVAVSTPARFFNGYLGLDPYRPLTPGDWLRLPFQRLRTVVSGAVYHDELPAPGDEPGLPGEGAMAAARRILDWYPRDVWLYLLANSWRRVDQEEPFMGRCGDVGDDLGSRLVAARLVNELMRISFLIERQYPPYSKWFGTAFARLPGAGELLPVFKKVLDAQGWKAREAHLSEAYRLVLACQQALHLTPELPVEISSFFDRPYLVPHSGRVVEALRAEIKDPQVLALPPYVGAVNQFSDSTDVLEHPDYWKKLAGIYL